MPRRLPASKRLGFGKLVSLHREAMGSLAFTRNYSDHSNDAGYQLEFNCDKCGNGYRTSFQAERRSPSARRSPRAS
jgi:hypothetical protein